MKVFLLLIGLLQMTIGCSDGGVCSSQPQNSAPCNVDHQTCMGAGGLPILQRRPRPLGA